MNLNKNGYRLLEEKKKNGTPSANERPVQSSDGFDVKETNIKCSRKISKGDVDISTYLMGELFILQSFFSK